MNVHDTKRNSRRNEDIHIKGARVHNLKNIDVKIPRYEITVITGLSGSGKSSLAFDTLYAEGQRRYLESLSTYSRQFLKKIQKPDVDHIEGIPPAIAFENKPFTKNSRSTVGTSTETYDYLRLLFARAGDVYCPECRRKILPKQPQEIVDELLSEEKEGRRFILFPVPLPEKGSIKILLQQLKSRGFRRILAHKDICSLDDPGTISTIRSKKLKELRVLLDRIHLSRTDPTRIADSLETAMKESGGRVEILDEKGRITRYTRENECPQCNTMFPKIQPVLFSFNSPLGACPRCRGFGRIIEIDLKKVIPDPSKSLEEGAVKPWSSPHLESRT